MFAVIYRFVLKENQEEKFIHAWAEMTKLIKQYEGGLGSRLHHEKENTYLAYAQWPDRKTWENFGSKLPEEAKIHSINMNEACEVSETIHTMNVMEDLLVK